MPTTPVYYSRVSRSCRVRVDDVSSVSADSGPTSATPPPSTTSVPVSRRTRSGRHPLPEKRVASSGGLVPLTTLYSGDPRRRRSLRTSCPRHVVTPHDSGRTNPSCQHPPDRTPRAGHLVDRGPLSDGASRTTLRVWGVGDPGRLTLPPVENGRSDLGGLGG